MRKAFIKSLIPKKTQDRLAQLLNTKARQRFVGIVAKTAWDTFYEQVWRIRCEKVNEWEKKERITSKMKREKRIKNSSKKRKANQQEVQKRKEQAKEKQKRIEGEVRKTMIGLVVEGRRPFHYGL